MIKIFLMLHREIIRYDGTEDNYVEELKYALLSKKELEERSEYLMGRALTIRAAPVTEYFHAEWIKKFYDVIVPYIKG